MSERGKRKSEDSGASDGDSDGTAAAPAKNTSKKHDGITVCELSKTRRVCVRSWQGRPVVDIREFYERDGKLLPGKKGIALNLEQKIAAWKAPPAAATHNTAWSPIFSTSAGTCRLRTKECPFNISLTIPLCMKWNILRDHVEEIQRAVDERS